MKTSVVSKEYLDLQKEIFGLQEKWKNEVAPDTVNPKFDKSKVEAGVPLASCTKIDYNNTLLLQWIDELEEVLVKRNPNLAEEFSKLKEVLDEKIVVKWMEEAFAINEVYFAEFSKQHNLAEWFPQYIAETVFRPYLQVAASKIQPNLNADVRPAPGCGCPVCGEPVRLGQIEGKGQKVLHCPRCLAFWLDKKISCVHCGNEDHETIQFLTIEGDSASQIHVCEKCKGYTKVIDTRQHLSKSSTPLLDLNTLHLDYIAQEKGYKVSGEKEQAN